MADEGWTDTVSRRFEGGPETVRDARSFVRVTLDGAGAGWAEDATLLASELATNAVIHAGTAYTVTVSVEGDRVRVEVADGSVLAARRCHYSATSGTGRGLGMIDDTAHAWGVEVAPPTGKVVWFELRAPAETGSGSTSTSTSRSDDAMGDDPVDLDALLAELGGDDELLLDRLRWAA